MGTAPSGSLRFRLAEDLRDPGLSARFEFKIGNLIENDQVKVWINQHSIPAERIERTYLPARPASQEIDSLPAGYLCRFEIPPEAVRSGDNELRLQLTMSAGKNKSEKLVAKEFEIHVKLK